MGVPKFYRWISERYPKINQIVSDSTLLPEFDNLYLDMNGILHTCTHPNDDGLSAQLSERDIILGIFHYIDRIVTHIVRPRRVLYMAIDGVAPRAKMNQQRSRRFRARKDMQEAKLVAESKGEMVDDSAVFDSNCITPGTEFMAKISKHLRYFVQKKITEDPLWKALTVTFSGHEVPGEGEHKIMAYIRDERSAGRLPPNTRHCMYGQDADLILLGLVTHEPHFTLLREVVNFGQDASRGKNASKVVVKTTRDAQFQLLHLSVLREYVWAEFTRDMPQDTEADMDRERAVDDFVFLTFLVGNDFLPHMPSLDIGEEAFSLIFQIYRSLKPGWGSGGYLTREGTIDCPDRLEEFLTKVGDREDSIFSERAEEEAEFRGRRRKTSKRFGRADDVPSEAEIALEEAKRQRTYEKAMIDTIGYIPETEDGGKDFKGRYYFEKFGITPLHTEIHDRLRAAYVEGLLWCLAYYYRGCISWGWFFPFHYVPMISDLTGLQKTLSEVKFELGEPFLPFEQLLGCLPGASANFLPASYGQLMLSPESPIIDFYPEDFEVDMNGKRNPWEAVNVLPFIDSYRLRAAVKELCPPTALSADEAERNTRGQVLEFYHNPSMSRKVMSCNPEIGLADIPQCTAASRVVPFSIEPGECFRPELPDDAIIPSAGFPSLHVLPIGSVEERKVPVNCFGSPSRYETLVLVLKRHEVLPTASALAGKVLGRSAYLNWPLMHEAQVVAISDENEEYSLKDVRGSTKRRTDVRTFTKDEAGRWRLRAAEEQGAYITGRGVPGSGGVDIGKVQLMIKARPLQGMRVDPDTGARRKVFGKETAEVPVHLVLWSCPSEDPRFVERENITLEERFPLGSRVTCLHGGNGHGCGGEVVAHRSGKIDVLADLRPPEPPFGLAIVHSVKTTYFPQHKACQSLGIKPQIFGRIVGSVMVDPGKVDLGLNLKQNGRYQLLGYSRCILSKEAAWSTSDTVRVVGSASETEDMEASSWEFSLEAIKLIARYARAFPQLFHGLARHSGERFFEANMLLGQGGKEKMEEISKWLSELETAGLQRVPLTTRALPRDAVKAVERGADVRQAVLVKNAMIRKTLLQDLKPSQLLAYDVADHTDAPMDTGGEKPDLGDRIVNMRAKGVPFGLWGTVVACHSHSGCVEVVFDEEFIGGTTLHGMCSNYRGALVPWATVAKIHTKARLEALRAGAAPKAAAAARRRAKASAQAGTKAPSPAPKATNISILRPKTGADKKLSQTHKQQHPAPTAEGVATNSSSNSNSVYRSVNAASTSALKGALGIGGGSRSVKVTTAAVPPPPPPQPSHSSSTAAAAGAKLKGILGVGEGSFTAAPVVEAAAVGGGDTGRNKQQQQEHQRRRQQTSGGAAAAMTATAPTTAATMAQRATADLKSLIGVGLRIPPPPPPQPPTVTVLFSSLPGTHDRGPPTAGAARAQPARAGTVAAAGVADGVESKQPAATAAGVPSPSPLRSSLSPSSSENKNKEAADRTAGGDSGRARAGGRTTTPPPPARPGGGDGGLTPSRLSGTRTNVGVLSPNGSDRRAAASHYRQAKGPDETGTGFRGGRGAGASMGGGAKATLRSVPPRIVANKKDSGTSPATSASSPAGTDTVVPGTTVSGSGSSADGGGSVAAAGGQDGVESVNIAGRASGSGEEADARMPHGTLHGQGRVLQEPNASPLGNATSAAGVEATVATRNGVDAAVISKGQQLMNLIGAGRSSSQASRTAAATAAAAASAAGPTGLTGTGIASQSGMPSQFQQDFQNVRNPGGALAQTQLVHSAQSQLFPRQQHAGRGGGVSIPPPPPPTGGGAEGDAIRALWQQQRIMEAVEHQRRLQHHFQLQQEQQYQLQRQHHYALQQQQQQQVVVQQQRLHHQILLQQQQLQQHAGRAGVVPVGAAFQQHHIGYPLGVMPQHQLGQQALLSYPRPPPPPPPQQQQGLAGVASRAAAPSSIVPKKPRRSVSEKESGGGAGIGEAKAKVAMMIPSSALLASRAGSRRGLSASSKASSGGENKLDDVAPAVAGAGAGGGGAGGGSGGAARVVVVVSSSATSCDSAPTSDGGASAPIADSAGDGQISEDSGKADGGS